MKELIKRWYEHSSELSIDDAAIIIREYCKIYGNREVSNEELNALFYIHSHITPIRFDKLIKYICIYYKYNIRELWSKPNKNGNRTLICCYFDD